MGKERRWCRITSIPARSDEEAPVPMHPPLRILYIATRFAGGRAIPRAAHLARSRPSPEGSS